ncbi:unnamed protein product [Brachionus calyciflorus]|uniref:Uncharacterized protein n=1 Tax=Brachionus calyciflorus TaxID=104777 RepID=A0A814EE94_9BILA|nr:unnamed protein product [Brachionus calyciflorus]
MNHIAKILANEPLDDQDLEGELPQDGHGQYDSIPAYRRPQYKLYSGLPIFGEKGIYDNLDEWIFAIENSVKAVGVPRNFILNVISPFLRGLPAQTLRQFTIDQESKSFYFFLNIILIRKT